MFFLLGALSFKYKPLLESNSVKFQSFTLILILIITIFMETPFISNIPTPIVYLVFAISLPNICNISKSLPGDRKIGEISYPLYLSHWLMLHMIANSYLPDLNSPKLAAFLYSIIISIFLIYFIEKRINLIRIKYTTKSKIY